MSQRGVGQTPEHSQVVDFDRDVRPILSDLCFGCHGPDEAARKADLRLDLHDGLFAQLDESVVVKPGEPRHSELFRRIGSQDDSLRMPPPEFKRRATSEQMRLVEQWIAQGAKWQPHWSFRRIERPPLPNRYDAAWVQNPIDAFVSAQLASVNLQPTPRARGESLIRRLSLDLLGLPPAPDDVSAFVKDSSAEAVDRVVDRWLAATAFGERLAQDWLDGARYADTSGYQNDGPRHMWRWRDWVIDAFNRGQAFDQFTIEQIAGDLLPQATLEQRIATGFQRNHRGNAEGGIVPEEFAIEYVVDRVETTSAVWLGLTMGCARCHDHKYDPIKQREFYQLFAFFNNIPEHGRAIKEGNSPPFLLAPTQQQQQQIEAVDSMLAEADREWRELQPALASTQEGWEASLRGDGESVGARWTPQRNLLVRFDGQYAQPLLQFDSYATDSRPRFCDGPVGRAIVLEDEQFVEVGDVGKFGYFDKFTLALWVNPQKLSGTILSRMTDAPEGDGYSLTLASGRLQLNLVKRWLDDAIRVETVSSLPVGQWTHVAATYDGSRKASGVQLYIQGNRVETRTNLDFLNQSFASPEPLRIGAGNGSENRFCGGIGEAHVYDRVLEQNEVVALASAQSIRQFLAKPRQSRTDAENFVIQSLFLERFAEPRFRRVSLRVQELREVRQRLAESLPTCMVMMEQPTPGATYVLARGQYDQPLEAVEAGVPDCLPALPENVPKNRLSFAKWLVGREQPLTARVIVNRYWQMLFGVGLVKTSEDFGLQGERPSHPELLDWLAADLIESNWNLKRLLRLIVSSATYQQSADGSRESWQRDPENRRLSRGPRFRMSAEAIRDSALAASGLLSRNIGGPSLKPYQPAGLWSEIASDTVYEQSQGEGLCRRSLYTYWKRTVAPPGMLTFDAPSRETCVVRRPITNTPLQALQLMNEQGYMESAEHLAERAIRESGQDVRDRLSNAFRLVLARSPRESELTILVRAWEAFVVRFQRESATLPPPEAAPYSPADSSKTASHDCYFRAYTAVASLILNLDEAITKE